MSKTTDLASVTTLADGDLGNVVDVSNTSMDATGTNSQVTMANLWAYIKTKADTFYQTILVSGTSIKTVGGVSLLGSGDISVGTGNVTKVGTPVNNQIGVWTGDGTLEGDTSLTFDTTTDTLSVAASGKIAMGAVNIIDDTAGTTTLSNIDALDDTTESTIEGAIDTLANLTSIQGRTVTLADAGANAIFGWDDVASAYENLTQGEVRAVAGLATTDSPEFTAINLGHASDTTITRSGAGAIQVEGVQVVLNATSPTLATITTTGNIELGHASDTTLSRSAAGVIAVEGVVIPSISSTNTLTNKRITRRVTTTNAPGATPTTNTDNVDVMNFTGLGTAITSMTTNLSGTPVDGDLIMFRFTDDGTARAITWGASFAATTVALPTTTVISTMLRVGFQYSGSTWKCIATA